jgi:hypothetical protein
MTLPPAKPGAAPAKYWAFISYSHQDKRVAIALQERLARARIPEALRGRVAGGHAVMRAVFRDEAEAAAGALDERLREALDASQALIVVCSPFSAASPYCLAEIAHFLATGRADRIFCLIASGKPNATDAGEPHLECFSPALRFQPKADGFPSETLLPAQDRPLAAVLGMESATEWAKALDQLAAGLLGLTQGELRDARRRRFVTRTGLAMAAGLGALATAALVWDGAYRPHIRYYDEFTRRNGAPEGIGPLAPADQKRRALSYALETRGRWSDRVITIRAVNGSGACPMEGLTGPLGYPFKDTCGVRRSCSAAFSYRSDATLEREELRDASGAPLERLIYAGPTVGQFYEAEFPCTREASGIKFVQFTRIADGPNKGLDSEVRFLGADRSPRPNASWAFGYRFDRDAAGRITARTVLGPHGAPAAARDDKTARIAYRRDADGRIIGLTRFDAAGAATTDAEGIHREDWLRDAVGNIIVRRFLDATGVRRPAANGAAGEAFRYDGRGARTAQIWLSETDAPMANADGVAEERAQHDQRGYVTSYRWFDEAGGAIALKDGRGADLTTRDPQGARLEWRTIGLDGAAIAYEGVALRRYAYNASGQQTSERYFDEAGRPTVDRKLGIAGYEQVYESASPGSGRSLPVLSRWLAPGGGFALANDGVKIARRSFDENGLIESVSYEDETGAPLPDRDGATGERYRYSAYGQIIEVVVLAHDAKPLRNPAIAAIIKRDYDARGNLIRDTRFDADGAARIDDSGSAGFRAEFDARDRMVLRVQLGPDGRDLVTPDQPRQRLVYDAYDRVIRIDYEGPDGAPIRSREVGAACVVQRYDRAGRLVETTYLDTEGRPGANVAGYAVLRQTYDRYGRETEREFLGPDGSPAAAAPGGPAGSTTRYTPAGQVMLTTYRGVDGGPARDPDSGAFAVRKTYDAGGRLAEEIFLGADGAPMLGPQGFAGSRRTYDAFGRQARLTYLGADLKPIQPTELAAQVATRYDAYGREIERRFFNAYGRPAASPRSGRAIVRVRYDQFGRVVEEQSLDVDEKPVTRRDEGWSRKTIAYDASGAERTAYFNAAGAPVDGPP